MYLEANFPKWTSSNLRRKSRDVSVRFAVRGGVLGARTHTTLVGHESLNMRTPNATSTMANKSFHSAGVMSNPPGGTDFRERPLEAAALLASASRCASVKPLYFDAVGSDVEGGGEGGRRARTVAMKMDTLLM